LRVITRMHGNRDKSGRHYRKAIKSTVYTHTNEADQYSEWHKDYVSNEKAKHPDGGYFPGNKFVVSIGACEHVPALELLRLKTRCYIVFDDGFHA